MLSNGMTDNKCDHIELKDTNVIFSVISKINHNTGNGHEFFNLKYKHYEKIGVTIVEN